ncbi:hypothetical protein KIN20_014357 [Parelaphostrongylus tenuis]|uniref:Uncharacterized protein n=1 Tax=Parelaphostrongylus tenuis TaxID=148309 RepID=A0AAD5QLM3_PARTN|nr:hypothetical protein KIN20_014357 [Parelaphostrongylus tenuis]
MIMSNNEPEHTEICREQRGVSSEIRELSSIQEVFDFVLTLATINGRVVLRSPDHGPLIVDRQNTLVNISVAHQKDQLFVHFVIT